MKLELIRSQLEFCEQALENDQSQLAIDYACLTARMLIMRCAEWQSENVQKSLIPLIGVAGAVQTQLQELTAEQDLASLTALLKKRLEKVQSDVAGTEQQYQQLKNLNQSILEEEEALRNQKKELEELQEKLKELIEIKDKKLKELQKATEEQKKKLEKLEKDYTECESLYKAVHTQLEENLRILAELPDKTGSDTLDELIAQGKETKDTLQTAAQSSSEPIRKIIEEVQRLRQMAEGTQ